MTKAREFVRLLAAALIASIFLSGCIWHETVLFGGQRVKVKCDGQEAGRLSLAVDKATMHRSRTLYHSLSEHSANHFSLPEKIVWYGLFAPVTVPSLFVNRLNGIRGPWSVELSDEMSFSPQIVDFSSLYEEARRRQGESKGEMFVFERTTMKGDSQKWFVIDDEQGEAGRLTLEIRTSSGNRVENLRFQVEDELFSLVFTNESCCYVVHHVASAVEVSLFGVTLPTYIFEQKQRDPVVQRVDLRNGVLVTFADIYVSEANGSEMIDTMMQSTETAGQTTEGTHAVKGANDDSKR